MTNHTQKADLLSMTVQVITSQKFMGPSSQFPQILQGIYKELKAIQKEEEVNTSKLAAVTSITPSEKKELVGEDFILCLEDNTTHKSLKRYIKAKFHMTWEEYLEKHNLPTDFPSVCYSLSKSRSNVAKSSKMWEMK